MKKNKRFNKSTYTKKWIARILVVAMIDIQFSYILAFLGREAIAETLSGIIVTEIIGVTLGYLVKSFFETREEKKHELEQRRMNSIYDLEDNNEIDEN